MHFHCYVCDTMCHVVVVHGVEAASLTRLQLSSLKVQGVAGLGGSEGVK